MVIKFPAFQTLENANRPARDLAAAVFPPLATAALAQNATPG
jgi:hypothetical protein